MFSAAAVIIHVALHVILQIKERGEYNHHCYYCYSQQLESANQISTHNRTNNSERYDGQNNKCEIDMNDTEEDEDYSITER